MLLILGSFFHRKHVGEPLQLVNPQERNKWQLENNSVTVDTGEALWQSVVTYVKRSSFRSVKSQVGSRTRVCCRGRGDRFLGKFREALIAAGISVHKTELSTL